MFSAGAAGRVDRRWAALDVLLCRTSSLVTSKSIETLLSSSKNFYENTK
jgi:hypothetical protein